MDSSQSRRWFSCIEAAKRFHAAQLSRIADMPGMGLEFVEVEDDGDMEMALDMGEPSWLLQVVCPYCYEDHDVASLCVHLEEDHPYERRAAPCPICSQKIKRDMLNHITVQHGYLFKNGHRSPRYFIPDDHAISLLSQDLRNTHLQALLEGRRSRRSSNSVTTSISSDPLLSSFAMNFPTPDLSEPSKSSSSIPDGASMFKETPPLRPWGSSINPSLTTEEMEQKRQQANDRATFVQGLLLSTVFGD